MKIFSESLPKAFALAFVLVPSAFFLSCEEALPLDLSGIENQIVIEGIVSNSFSSSRIKLGFTQSAFEKAQPRNLSGALATLSDDSGSLEVLKEGDPGVYTPSTMTGVPGRVYKLRVVFGDKEYTAESRMPVPMSLDSIKYVKSSSLLTFGSTSLKYYLTDKPGKIGRAHV
jgi:hypothetical protein